MTTYGLDRNRIIERLEWKRKQAAQREQQLFTVLDQSSNVAERELLEYLYAYMPLHDLADYDGEYFAAHVRHVLATRKQMPWGEKIPNELFLQYVLPYRVNNENIDDSRRVIHDLLVDRVHTLSMVEAIIETNYWCHEHATYTGTDIRTVSPLTIMRTALGRCGEQSTFTVTALRSIGIPARQCYTPRWAHCDSNHAWVEAWAEGQWHYLGACEPEPVLNEGWFRLPAKRAMLVHTRVPADYIGSEEICSIHPWYTEINVLDHYAATKPLHIQTVDEAGQPCVAEVQFQQYNAAEFYPLAILQTDDDGTVALTTGYGDLLIHARTLDGELVGESFVTSQQTSATLRLKPIVDIHAAAPVEMDERTPALQSGDHTYTIDWNVQPPPAPVPEPGPEVSEADRQLQEQRVHEGTALRTAYEHTFLTAEEIEQYAIHWSLPSERLSTVFHTARGNGRELVAFFEQTESGQRELALQLLESMRQKDWQDTDRVTLADHLQGVLPYISQQRAESAQQHTWFQRYVLCPRIHIEMIAPYRQYLSSRWDEALQQQFRNDPQQLAAQIQREVNLVNDVDRYSGMATPAGAHRLGVADSLSRAIVFVAAARTLGIAARLEPLHLLPQYWQEDSWHDACFTDELSRHSSRGVGEDAANELPVDIEAARQKTDHPLTITAHEAVASNRGYIEIEVDQQVEQMESERTVSPPAYYQDFTIALLNNGVYETLQFSYGDSTITGHLHEVLPGSYRLTTGTRLRDGSVLGRFTFFQVESGQKVSVKLERRQAKENVPVLAHTLPAAMQAKLLENERDYKGNHDVDSAQSAYATVIAWLEPEREPTKHVLREFAELEQQFSERHERILLLLQEQAEQQMLEQNILPPQAVISYDDQLSALHELDGTLEHVLGDQRPVVLVIDTQGRIRFAVQGYKPGTATDLLQVLDQLLLER
ncbi:transglutaminase-like domain-containing protein [Paenibacillus wenxiniae]|uniref:Transglutaminase-like domain-containing protein n=1 Tax=Paenibacillus wenxiniae TaxID=1636843 RepID=A0ABW4RN86_9BACL